MKKKKQKLCPLSELKTSFNLNVFSVRYIQNMENYNQFEVHEPVLTVSAILIQAPLGSAAPPVLVK